MPPLKTVLKSKFVGHITMRHTTAFMRPPFFSAPPVGMCAETRVLPAQICFMRCTGVLVPLCSCWMCLCSRLCALSHHGTLYWLIVFKGGGASAFCKAPAVNCTVTYWFQGPLIYCTLSEQHAYRGFLLHVCAYVHLPLVLMTDEMGPPHTVCLCVFTAGETSPPHSH